MGWLWVGGWCHPRTSVCMFIFIRWRVDRDYIHIHIHSPLPVRPRDRIAPIPHLHPSRNEVPVALEGAHLCMYLCTCMCIWMLGLGGGGPCSSVYICTYTCTYIHIYISAPDGPQPARKSMHTHPWTASGPGTALWLGRAPWRCTPVYMYICACWGSLVDSI